MTWRKHFQLVSKEQKLARAQSQDSGYAGGAYGNKFSSYLPEVYSGAPNRLERYQQYDQMNLDSEITAALDIIADFSTQIPETEDSPFQIFFKGHDSITETESEVLKTALNQWVSINDFNKRIWRMFRNTITYGDCFFVRDPETFEWIWIDQYKVKQVVVNEAKGKKPEQYIIADLDLNLQTKVGTIPRYVAINQIQAPINSQVGKGASQYSQTNFTGSYTGKLSGALGQQSESAVNAEHVVHLSLSEGMDANWPFGNSILETVFKVFKQKELLEDALIIYRVQRAPERRVFYIDVGNMPAHKAMAYIERVKNEIHQRRIPNRTGGGASILDAAYNPLAIIEDYFFAQTCQSLASEIALLDGRNLTLQQIIDEYNSGKINYTYSQNRITNELEPGKIIWAGKTRLNAQLVEVLLDNGKKIKVTPDHRFIMRDGSEVQAQHLKEGDSLMPLYLIESRTSSKQKGKPYLRYIDNATGKAKWVHTAVMPKSKPGKEIEIHHKDFNSRNNNPDNLVELTTEEHKELHKAAGTYSLGRQWNNPEERQKLIDGMHTLYENADEEFWNKLSERNKQNANSYWAQELSERHTNSLNTLANNRRKMIERRKVCYDDALFDIFKSIFLQTNGKNILRILENNGTFMNHYREINSHLNFTDKNLAKFETITWQKLTNLCRRFGYNNYQDFKEQFKNNHKVVSVTWLEEKEDTGDITIETPSGSHIFALTAGVFIHNSDGRGSKVDTLPAGENLGQIDDLKFFNNKLIRGLRVPSAYLPTGPDDGTQSYTDGRVGTAYIQEFRFSQYCYRMQLLVHGVFDDEFKLFLSKRGIRIDPSVFELRFWPPQNFAKFRQIEVDAAQINVFQPLADIKYFSKRFLQKRFLGMTDAEVLENQKLWMEENPGRLKGTVAPGDVAASEMGLGAVGIRPGAPPGLEEPGAEAGPEGGPEMTTGGPEEGAEGEAGGPAPAGAGGPAPGGEGA